MIPPILFIYALGCPSGPNYGAFKTPIREARATLAAEPCNEAVMVKLAGYLDSAGFAGEAVAPMKAFAGACTPGEAFLDTRRAGAPPLPGDPWLFKNFQGTVARQLARVDQFGIGSFQIAGVDVMLVDELPDGLQGMMGADLLSRIALKGKEKGDLWTVQAR